MRSELHRMREVARGLVPRGDRLEKCYRIAVDKDGGEVHRDRRGHASYQGWYTCGRRQCPMCSWRLANADQTDAERAMRGHQATGGINLLLTLTAPHTQWTDPALFTASLYAAWMWMTKHRQWAAVRRAFGLDWIRALDWTYGAGDNGHHAHFHVLLFVAADISHAPGLDECVLRHQLERALSTMWREACLRSGLQAPSDDHGVRVDGGRSAGRYVAGWDLAAELTRGDQKTGAGDTPLRLLQRAGAGDAAAAQAWQQYERATAGRRTIEWSRGLRDRYPALDQDERTEIIALLSPDDMRLIGRRRLHAAVLDAAERDGRDGVLSVLAAARVNDVARASVEAPGASRPATLYP